MSKTKDIWEELLLICVDPEGCDCIAGRAIQRGQALERVLLALETMDCNCGYETGSDSSDDFAMCERCEALKELDK